MADGQASVAKPVHLETMRHIFTSCEATPGRRRTAEAMQAQCKHVRNKLAGEGGDRTATTFVNLAHAGWEATKLGRPVGAQQWAAMQALLGGAVPTWVDATDRRVEVTRRATGVVGHVREMQREAMERIHRHQQRGAVGAQWVQERVHDRRPWMRQVLRSWASVCVGGARLGPNERVHSDDEWRAMRASETKATRVRRRQHEAIKRLINFGKIVVAKDKRRAQL